MELHVPYLALRKGERKIDVRSSPQHAKEGLRSSMSATLEGPAEDLFYYESLISCLVIGVAEWFWTAYCCTDTFGGDRTPTEYVDDDQDGPTGGSALTTSPTWNPRTYFLLVLSCRIRQATKEWAVVVKALQSRLESYVRLNPPSFVIEADCRVGARVPQQHQKRPVLIRSRVQKH